MLNNQQKELLGFTTKPPKDAIRQQTVIPVEELPEEYEKNLKL